VTGYVHTNLSKNAYIGNEGEKFGYTDANNYNGMKVDNYAKEAVRAIYRREKECRIGRGIVVPFIMWIRNMWPDLAFLWMRWNHGSQQEAIRNCKL